MGKKRDIQQIEAIARMFHFSASQREEFGEFLEQEKAEQHRGTLNARGDFTWQELVEKAKEFLNE
jgi:hypothetical protein